MELFAKTEGQRLSLFHLACLYFHGDRENLTVKREDGESEICVTLSLGERTVQGTALINEKIHLEPARAESAAVGLAFARAAEKLCEYMPPYGTLMGVRPVKVPLFYLERGLEETEVASLLEKEYRVSREKVALLLGLAEEEMRAKKVLSPEDAMLYLSIPFCPSRCSYCSFISSSAPEHLSLLDQYVSALTEEIRLTAEAMAEDGRRLKCIYMGGGTPGVLSPKQMERTLSAVKESFSFSSLTEFCVEIGRPDTVTEEKLALLRKMGVDRISINPQTVHNATLERIGRRHTAEEFFRAMALAKKQAFPVINCDLIAALPGEDGNDLLQSVDEVLALRPENLTLHALSLKKSAEDRAAPDVSAALRQAVEEAHGKCINAGLFPYYLYRQKNTASDLENVGFALRGKESLYNLAMMEDLADIYACGAGGIGKALSRNGGRIRRYAQYKYPYEYLADPARGRELLAKRKREAAEEGEA